MFNWRNLRYIISTKWNRLTGEHEDISCPRTGKHWLENSAIFHAHEMEKFNQRDLRHFMSTKYTILTGELLRI